MTPDSDQPAESGAGEPSNRSVPIDMSRYEVPGPSKDLRSYFDDEPEPELYLDGAGGVTTDRARAVLPSAIVSEPQRAPLEPYKPSTDTTFSDLNGFYVGLATDPKRKDRDAEQTRQPPARPRTPQSPQVLQPTNAFAIVALVCALIGGSVLGIVFGHVALSQIRRTGERGEGMANAALVIGYLALIALVIIVIISAVTAANAAHL
jgi:hypothetical protein